MPDKTDLYGLLLSMLIIISAELIRCVFANLYCLFFFASIPHLVISIAWSMSCCESCWSTKVGFVVTFVLCIICC